ncbi:response regulator [Paenibacillus alginolyticus]|uniref:response regulator transcription factor n=1 Tax=Paenibacillus alginolyticus TaxID=59839 RepID=UPI000422E579|nr:response regulator [Paenibacillus alginolyticus]MCY9670331.1 response regulator [Paenibacillus alginolyticus]
MKLLIVDDEEHLVESMIVGIAWKEAGVTAVLSAYSGKQALDVMDKEAADIVLTDVRMPGMNGIELIKVIKSKWPQTEYILLTGHAEFEYAKEGLNQKVTHYLLKPVKDAELLSAVKEVADALLAEREQIMAYVQSQAMVYRNLPILRSNLLNNLIQGRIRQERKLAEQMLLYDIPIVVGDTISFVLIRLEDHQKRYVPSDMSILGFAVTNIVEELLADGYKSWSCEDLYGNILFIVKRSVENLNGHHLEQIADDMRRIVNQLLHLTISVILSPSGSFPDYVEDLYQRCIATVRSQIGYDSDFVVRIGGDNSKPASHVVASLYSPPLFAHLLEAGNWRAAKEKLEDVFSEWRTKFSGSNEHLFEIYYSLKSAFTYFVHKSGRWLADYGLHAKADMKSDRELEYWATSMLDRLQDEMNADLFESRHSVVTLIKQFVQEHLSEDVSLQTIADYVHLHPTHVSKVFKRETAENISDYLLRLRMEKAVFLLKDTRYKIYEVASLLGYKNATYFIKVFKDHLGVTPQEFRE